MKRIAFILAIIGTATMAQAQYDSTEKVKKFDPQRLVFGGTLGASFGANYTFVQLSPQVGYMFNQYLTAGGGINYIYSSSAFPVYSTEDKYKYSYAGINVFGRVSPVRFLFLSAQPELNYNWGKIDYQDNIHPDEKMDAQFVPSLLLGAGVMLPTGGRGGLMLSIQYDVLQHNRSPYGSNAFFSIGAAF